MESPMNSAAASPSSEWVEKMDSSSGKTYLYNIETGESKPFEVEGEENDVARTAPPSQRLSSSSAPSDSAPSITLEDEQAVSNVVSSFATVEGGAAAYDEVNDEFVSSSAAGVGEDDEDFASPASAASREIDFSNTGIKRLSMFMENTTIALDNQRRAEARPDARPDTHPTSDDSDSEPSNALVLDSASASLVQGSLDGLEDDPLAAGAAENPWQEVDDGAGSTYFHNIVTGESQWDQPTISPLTTAANTPAKPPAVVTDVATVDNVAAVTSVAEAEVESEHADDSPLELLDATTENWPVVDSLIGTIGSAYAKTLGMSDDEYQQLCGIKIDYHPDDDDAAAAAADASRALSFAATSSSGKKTTRFTLEEIYKTLDEVMSKSFHHINQTFREMDENRDGTLQPEEFRNALKAHGMSLSDSNFKILWRDFDADGDGSITYKEFVRQFIAKPDKEVPDFYAWSIAPWRMIDAGTFVYYQNDETGKTQREMPTPAFEKKIEALERLTPRDGDDLKKGFVWRQADEEVRRKRRFERDKQKEAESAAARRRDFPTDFEQIEDVMEDMVHTVEYELTEEKVIAEYEYQVKTRSVWHPATFGFKMKDLPEGGQGSEQGVFSRKLVTDVEFHDAKVTRGRAIVSWHPLAKKPYKTKSQSLWAKFTGVNRSTSSLRGGILGMNSTGSGTASTAVSAVLDETKTDSLLAAITGLSTANDSPEEAGDDVADRNDTLPKANLDQDLGTPAGEADLAPKAKGGLLSALRSRISGGNGGGGGGGGSGDVKKEVKDEGMEEPDSNESDEEVLEAWKEWQKGNSKRLPFGKMPFIPKVGFSKVSKKTEEDGGLASKLKEKKKGKPSVFSKLNPFKQKKTQEEIEVENEEARALVFGNDADSKKKAKDIYITAKKGRKPKPWEKALEKPIDFCQLNITLVMHAPKPIEVVKTMFSVEKPKEGGKEGEMVKEKKERIVLNSSKRTKFEADLVHEIAHIGHISKKHVTIDEIQNRNTEVGYYYGSTWVLGEQKGEFKSSREKQLDEQERLERERLRKLGKEELIRQKTAQEGGVFSVEDDKLPAIQSPGKRAVAASGEEKKDADSPPPAAKTSSTPTLPPIGGGGGEESSDSLEAANVSVKRKRDMTKNVVSQNEHALGRAPTINHDEGFSSRNENHGIKRQASSANQLNMQATTRLIEEANNKIKKDLEGAESTGMNCVPSLFSDDRSIGMNLISKLDKTLRCHVNLTITASKDRTALENCVRICQVLENDHSATRHHGTISTVVRCFAEPLGERVFFEDWENYWSHAITPVFFGYSTTDFFKTKTKHKIRLGPPKVKANFKNDRLKVLQADYDRACVEYKHAFPTVDKTKEHWTHEQLSAHNRRERTEFKIDMHIKHASRYNRQTALEKEPEPWRRPRAEPKPYTREQVEQWKHKFYKKELKKRKKRRKKNKITRDLNAVIIKRRIWDRKVENWFSNKLLSFNSKKMKERIVQKMDNITKDEEVAQMKFVRDETDEVLIKEFNDKLTTKNTRLAEEAKRVVELFNQLKGFEKLPAKRDLLSALAKDKKLKAEALKLPGVMSIIKHPEFISCFMVAPAKLTGHVNVDEFSTFCKCAASIGSLYMRAKEAIKEEDTADERAEEDRAKRKVELRKMREQQKLTREKVNEERDQFRANNINGVHFKPGQRRVRDESGNVWEKFHYKCIIKLPNEENSYCCNSRQKKWEYDLEKVLANEKNWRSLWQDTHDLEKDKKKINLTEMVERRITAGSKTMSKSQKQTMRMLLGDMVSKVENRFWVESEVCSVLYGLADDVSSMEAERLEGLGESFVWQGVDRKAASAGNGGHDSDDEEEEVLPEGWFKHENEDEGVWYEHAETKDTAWEYPGQTEFLERKRLRDDEKERQLNAIKLGDRAAKLETMGMGDGRGLELKDFMTTTTSEAEAIRRGAEKAEKIRIAEERLAAGEAARVEQNRDTFVKVNEGENIGGNVGGKATGDAPKKQLEIEEQKITRSLTNSPGKVGFGGLGELAAARALVQKEEMEEEAKTAEEEKAVDGDGKSRNAIGKVHGDAKASKLSIDVFDMDVMSKGDFLGTVNVPFEILAATNRGSSEIVELPLARAEAGSVNDSQSVEVVRGTLGFILTPLQLNKETDEIEQWTFRIMNAKKVAKADLMGKSDPFCVVRWGTVEMGKGSCIKNTLSPEWGGGEADTFTVPSEKARKEDDEHSTALRRTMLKTKGLGDGVPSMRSKMLGSMLKRSASQIMLVTLMGAESKDKIADEVSERMKFWEVETIREEMERRYLWREDLRQKKLQEMRLRATERPLRDEQEAGHRAYLDVINKCRGLKSSLLRYKWHKTLQFHSAHSMLVQVEDPSSKLFKVVNLLPCEYDEDCERVLKEGELVEDVTHSGVVRVQSVQRHLIQHFELHGAATQRWNLAIFVSEWCEGGKLIDLLRSVDNLDVSGRQMQMWCQQAAAGLRALHELNIVHRNLNPGNVYLDGGGKAKIGGFMCLKESRGPGCGFSFGRCDVGSPMIIAPEVDDGYEVTPACDIWAFGCCMYYWCTGTLPDLRQMGVEKALKNVSLHFGARVRGAIRMALQTHPQVRSTADEIWMYLSVLDVVHKKKKRALERMRSLVGKKESINHGDKSKFGGLLDSIKSSQTNTLKLKLLAAKEAAAKTEAAE